MDKTSEKYIERFLTTEIQKLGGLCFKLLTYNVIGLPDRLCLLPGNITFFVETKSKGRKPTKIQLLMHEKIRATGHEVYVIDSIEGVIKLLQKYDTKI